MDVLVSGRLRERSVHLRNNIHHEFITLHKGGMASCMEAYRSVVSNLPADQAVEQKYRKCCENEHD